MTRSVFNSSCLIAFIPVLLVLRHYHIRGWPFLLGLIALTVVAGAICTTFLKAGVRIYLFYGNRNYARKKPKEALLEAERFYYLALWGALTGKKAFAKKMLEQAKQMGFDDTSKLHDPTLESITA